MERFGLRDAVIVPSDGSKRLRQHLGPAAATYLERILREDDVAGIVCRRPSLTGWQ